MRRPVVKVENVISKHARGSGGSNYLTLSCGHVKRQKASIPVPTSCNCKECDDIASGKSTEWEFEPEIEGVI